MKSDKYKYSGKERIEEATSLNSTHDSVDPYNYHVLKRSQGVLKTMDCNQIQSCYPIEEVDEDDEEKDIWRIQRELDDWVEKQRS